VLAPIRIPAETENMNFGALFMAIFLTAVFVGFLFAIPYVSKWSYQLRCKFDDAMDKRFPPRPREEPRTEIRTPYLPSSRLTPPSPPWGQGSSTYNIFDRNR
jgi:hypothetical protein